MVWATLIEQVTQWEGGLAADGADKFPSQGFVSEDFDLTHPYLIPTETGMRQSLLL